MGTNHGRFGNSIGTDPSTLAFSLSLTEVLSDLRVKHEQPSAFAVTSAGTASGLILASRGGSL